MKEPQLGPQAPCGSGSLKVLVVSEMGVFPWLNLTVSEAACDWTSVGVRIKYGIG